MPKKKICAYLDDEVANMLEKFFKTHKKRHGDVSRLVNIALFHMLKHLLDENENNEKHAMVII